MNNLIHKNTKGIYEVFLKRIMDVVLSLIVILALLPLLLILAIVVRTKLGKPVLFKQKRPGLDENIFWLYKFRSMTNNKDINGEYLSDEKRLTSFGKFLRSTSLDELPSLFNILKGDMSIVGPRPLLVQYLPLYSNHQKRRHNVRPGLTGLAQISGRNAITWEQKFDLDVKYVDNISFLGDCKIIFKTIKKVLVREGISADNTATMDVFTGSKTDSN